MEAITQKISTLYVSKPKTIPSLAELIYNKLDLIIGSPVTISKTDEHEIYVKNLFITHCGLIEIGNRIKIETKGFRPICKLAKADGKLILDKEKTYATIQKLDFEKGNYLISNPFCRKTHVPPPDIFLFQVSTDKKVVDHIGIECKASVTHKPTFNDTFPKTFSESKIIYFFTHIYPTESYNTVFTSDTMFSNTYAPKIEDIINAMNNEFDTILNLYKAELKSLLNDKDFSVILGYRRKNEISGSHRSDKVRKKQIEGVKNILKAYSESLSEPETEPESESIAESK